MNRPMNASDLLSRRSTWAVPVAAAAAIALGGCGSSSKSSSSATSTPASTTTATSSTASSTPSASGGATVTTGPVHAALRANDHAPVANKAWPYTVLVTDASGHPLDGSVRIQFTFAGSVVGTDSPPVHPVKHGIWRDSLTYPTSAVGQPLTFQAVVTTSAGSVTLNWPVNVRR
jgi:hypothetical protein